MVAFDHDQCNDTSYHEAKVDGEVSGHGDQETSFAADVFALVGCFGATCSASGIFACICQLAGCRVDLTVLVTSSTEPSNTSSNYHHPKHAKLGDAMSGSSQHDTQDKKECRKDDARSSANLVDKKAEEQHAEDLSNKIGVGQSGLDDAGHAIFVQVCE